MNITQRLTNVGRKAVDEYCSTMNVPMEENIMTSCNYTGLWVFTKGNQAMNYLVRIITDMITMEPKSKLFSVITTRNRGLISYRPLRPIPTISGQMFYTIGRYNYPFLYSEHASNRIRELDHEQPIFHSVEKVYRECCFAY